MSILKKIESVRASYNGSSFLVGESMDIQAGNKLAVLSVPQNVESYPDYVTVSSFTEGTLAVEETLQGLMAEDEVVFGILTPLKDPQSLQWDIADLEGASGRNQSGRYFRDVISNKRTLSCSWGALDNRQMASLLSMMEEVFFTLEYPDALTGERKRAEFYVGNRTVPMLKQADDGTYMWQNVSATFTER